MEVNHTSFDTQERELSQIKTKWHVMQELLSDPKNVYGTANFEAGLYAPTSKEIGMDIVQFKSFLEHAEDMPKFYFDKELITLADNKEYQRSLLDMKRAGVLKLPYEDMVVEFQSTNHPHNHYIVMIGNTHNLKVFPDSDVVGIAINVCKDEDGHYLAVPTTLCGLTLEDVNGDPWINVSASGAIWVDPKSERIEELISKTYQKDAMNVGIAWYLISLIMGTKGVATEAIETTNLNKKRKLSGKPAIPTHTYLRIGHVYQKNGSTKIYDERKSPRPHWRRGHVRNVRHGEGRKETKPVWIEPMLVAWHGDEFTAPIPNYSVNK